MAKKSARDEPTRPADPETEEKRRLRALAISRKLLRRTPAKPSAPLEPSRAALRLEGRDIVKRGQRRSRYLFSFPGLLAPLSGGRVGELANLATKNPVLYLEFPQGRMKLFGTHVYPKNKYLTLQLTKSSKGVMCEDLFESLIVFSGAWWIGRKEENPEEFQLEFPKDLTVGQHADYDFKGGAGASLEEVSCGTKPEKECAEPLSPDTEMEDETPEGSHLSTSKHMKDVMEATPTRHSARTAGRKFNYAESSSGDDSIASDAEESDMMDKKADVRTDNAMKTSLLDKTEGSSLPVSSLLASKSEFVEIKAQSTRNIEQSPSSLKKSKESPSKKKGSLVQATLSNLFEQVVEKKSKRKGNGSPGPKGSESKRRCLSSKKITDLLQAKESNKKETRYGRKETGTEKVVQKNSQVQHGDTEEIEEISSESQDDSDEDWAE